MKNFVLAIFMTSVSLITSASADEIKVLAANAVKGGYSEIVSAFEKASGHQVSTTFAGTVAATNRVSGGETFDLVIIGSDSIDQLIKAGKLANGSRIDFARSGVAAAVRVGLTKPDISSAERLKATVLDAQSIAYSAGPSGAYIHELMKRLDVTRQIEGRVKQPSSGAEVASLLQKGEVDLGFGQVSEFMNVAGLVNLGPLPQEIQNYTIYAMGSPSQPAKPEVLKALVDALKGSTAAPALRRMGMEPG